jgi:hypothetical protein
VRKATIGLAVLISLLAVAGCGGGGSSTISEAEYEQELEIVCNKGMKAYEETYIALTEEYEEKGEEEVTSEEQAENLRTLNDVYQETTEEIAEIDLPEGKEKKAEDLVREREEAAAKVEASPLGSRDTFGSIFQKANDLADSFGATSCN